MIEGLPSLTKPVGSALRLSKFPSYKGSSVHTKLWKKYSSSIVQSFFRWFIEIYILEINNMLCYTKQICRIQLF